jgi:hypothetical protein
MLYGGALCTIDGHYLHMPLLTLLLFHSNCHCKILVLLLLLAFLSHSTLTTNILSSLLPLIFPILLSFHPCCTPFTPYPLILYVKIHPIHIYLPHISLLTFVFAIPSLPLLLGLLCLIPLSQILQIHISLLCYQDISRVVIPLPYNQIILSSMMPMMRFKTLM